MWEIDKYNMTISTAKNKGFTLVELMVVIAIIGTLSSIVLSSLNNARGQARDAVRKQDFLNLQNALELYHLDNNAYPSTGSAFWGLSVNGGSRTTSGANAYIPGLTPSYISVLPSDPRGDLSGWSGYIYISNGTDYKLIDHINGPEIFPAAGTKFYDPVRPTWAWAVCNDKISTFCTTQ
jgi:general secretion pathway protein G